MDDSRHDVPRRSTTYPSAFRKRSPRLPAEELAPRANDDERRTDVNDSTRSWPDPREEAAGEVRRGGASERGGGGSDGYRSELDNPYSRYGDDYPPAHTTITMLSARGPPPPSEANSSPSTAASSRLPGPYSDYYPQSECSSDVGEPTRVPLPPSRQESHASFASRPPPPPSRPVSSASSRPSVPPSRYPTPDFVNGRNVLGSMMDRVRNLTGGGERQQGRDRATEERRGSRRGDELSRSDSRRGSHLSALQEEEADYRRPPSSQSHHSRTRHTLVPPGMVPVAMATSRSVTFDDRHYPISDSPPLPLSPSFMRNRHHSPTFPSSVHNTTQPLRVIPSHQRSQPLARRQSSISSFDSGASTLFDRSDGGYDAESLTSYLPSLGRSLSHGTMDSFEDEKKGDKRDKLGFPSKAPAPALPPAPSKKEAEAFGLGPGFLGSGNVTHKFPIDGRRADMRPAQGAGGGGGGAGDAAQGSSKKAAEKKWTGFKLSLVLSIITIFGYSLAGLAWSLTTWFRTRDMADVTLVADQDVLIYLTFASSLCLFTAIVGLCGALLNSRPILAFYNLLLWPCLLSICLIGYTSYKREALKLDRKLNQAWSQFYDDVARLRIQNSLHCCGFYNPMHEASFSKTCYPRSTLPGCKGKLYRFEKVALASFATAAFSVVPVHLLNILIALLCSNHVNLKFGKGITPKQYRLSMADVRSSARSVLDLVKQRKIDRLTHQAAAEAKKQQRKAAAAVGPGPPRRVQVRGTRRRDPESEARRAGEGGRDRERERSGGGRRRDGFFEVHGGERRR